MTIADCHLSQLSSFPDHQVEYSYCGDYPSYLGYYLDYPCNYPNLPGDNTDHPGNYPYYHDHLDDYPYYPMTIWTILRTIPTILETILTTLVTFLTFLITILPIKTIKIALQGVPRELTKICSYRTG